MEIVAGLINVCLDCNCRGGRFFMKNHLTEHSTEEAFRTGLESWALWMEHNLDPSAQVFFRSFASVHFR